MFTETFTKLTKKKVQSASNSDCFLKDMYNCLYKYVHVDSLYIAQWFFAGVWLLMKSAFYSTCGSVRHC